MKNYLKLIRIKHWLKNILIFLPIFFSGNIFNVKNIIYAIIGFFAFSFIASCVYIINDLNDIESDRKHEVKKNRPLASGKIKKSSAIKVIILLIISSLAINTYLYLELKNIFVFVIPLAYLIINILYSIWLKHKPIIDVVALVSGFLLRVIYGAAIINVTVSNWLYLMIMFGSFYLVFGKRRNEIMKNGNDSRKVLKFYNKEFLDKNMYVFLSMALIAYSLWCVDPITLARIGNNLLIWSVPIVVVIFLMYSLNVEGNSYGDPIDVVTKDKSLLMVIAIYIIYMFLSLYFI